MKLQRLLSLTRQAVDDYALIDSGDKIAVGISGGKDSLTLLIAYAHHRDDLIETMLLSPKTFLDRTELTVIRPMIYVSEADVIGFKNRFSLPVCKNPCPVDGKTKREYVKQLTKQLNLQAPGVKERLFHAITEGNIEGWPDKKLPNNAR